MKLTLKENINYDSVMLQHRIITQAIVLLSGREESLQTEKEMYLILSLLNTVVKEDLIQEINDDDRELIDIIEQELEPYFMELMKNEGCKKLYNTAKDILLDYYAKLYERQHSMVGFIQSIFASLGSLSEEDTKEILDGVKKAAEVAYEHRTEIMAEKTEKVNDSLEKLIEQYEVKVEE